MQPNLKRLYELKSAAHAAQQSEPDRAAALFRQCIDGFRVAGDERAELEATHWLLQTLNCFAGRYGEALDVGVRAVVKAKGPQYANFTTRICLHEDLISAYIGVDPEGYETEIRDLLDYMRAEIAPNAQCAFCLRYRSFDLEWWLENFEAASEIAHDALAKAQSGWYGQWHRVGYLGELCDLACASGGMGADQMADWAREREELARRASRTSVYASCALHQACGLRQGGDETGAKKQLKRARSLFKTHGPTGFEGYFIAARYYAQIGDEWDAVAALCDAELDILRDKSAPARTARVHRWKCQSLARVGKLDAQSLQSAREIAGKLRAPRAELKRLDLLSESS